MVDDPMIGKLLGPNITAGRGGRTANFTAADWDRIVRHGVRSDGHPAVMPSEEFKRMSDEELSDIVSLIRSQPTVDAEVPQRKLGPLGTMLVAFNQIPLAADLIEDHQAAHPVMPPVAEASVDFGKHLAGTCSGCHRSDFSGGPIPGGDPGWPPAKNLTPAGNLANWTVDQFATLLRTGMRPDGTKVLAPMDIIMGYGQNMTDTEIQALFSYLQSLPATPTPQ
jgi:mono/diheme cytochrome c family protein